MRQNSVFVLFKCPHQSCCSRIFFHFKSPLPWNCQINISSYISITKYNFKEGKTSINKEKYSKNI